MPRYDLICTECKKEQIDVIHSIHEGHPPCASCGKPNETLWRQAPSAIGDECDVYIKHGICWPDGTPKRYRSKSEMREAAFEKGLIQGGDTPKKNHRLEEARAAAEEKKYGRH
jgi:hypothetical protein